MKIDKVLKNVIFIIIIVNLIIFDQYPDPPQFSFILLIILILFSLVRLIKKKRIDTKGLLFKINVLVGVLNLMFGLLQFENLLYFTAVGLSWIYIGATVSLLPELKDTKH